MDFKFISTILKLKSDVNLKTGGVYFRFSTIPVKIFVEKYEASFLIN